MDIWIASIHQDDFRRSGVFQNTRYISEWQAILNICNEIVI